MPTENKTHELGMNLRHTKYMYVLEQFVSRYEIHPKLKYTSTKINKMYLKTDFSTILEQINSYIRMDC